MAADVARLFQMSAQGGHAGPGSSWDYVHLIEEPLAHWMRRARPTSWVPVEPHGLDSVLFPDIGEGLLLEARTVPPPRAIPAVEGKPAVATVVTLTRRLEVTRRLVAGETVEEVAGHCPMDPGDVLTCLRTIALAFGDAGLADEEALNTPSRQIDEIWRHRTWVAAAGRVKLVPVVKGLEQLLADGRDDAAKDVWNAWLRCVDGKDLSLDRSRPASVLLRFLIKAGLPRTSLAITAAQQALPLPRHLAEQKLVWRRCQPRAGRPKYRLALVARHVKASSGKARQVSVVGLHWLMLMAGSVILTKEK